MEQQTDGEACHMVSLWRANILMAVSDYLRLHIHATMASLIRSTRTLSLTSSTSRSFSTTSTLLKPTKPATPAAEGEARPRRVLTFKTTSGLSNFKTFLPVTPSLRQLRQPISEHLHKGDPLRALTIAKRSTGGRNESGRITVRARGGGHKRRIRNVDFNRAEAGEQEVVRIEYDPGRSAHIALIKHKVSGDLSYILAPVTLREGDVVQSFRAGIPDSFAVRGAPAPVAPASALLSLDVPGTLSAFAARSGGLSDLTSTSSVPSLILPTDPSLPQTVLPPAFLAPEQVDLGVLRSLAVKPGNCLPIRFLPPGTPIHAISLTPNGPFILCRSAGTSARIISAVTEGKKHAQVKLSSGEVRLVGLECLASVGVVSNNDHQHRNLGKAGRMRWLGFRPQTRGVAMNA